MTKATLSLTFMALTDLLCMPLAADDPKTEKGKSEGDSKAQKGFDAKAFLDKYDKNKDGKLSRDELPEGTRKGFDRIDADSDGKVTQSELQRHGERMARSGPVEVVTVWVVAAARDPIDREDLQNAYESLRKLDADNDGKITDKEIEKGRTEMISKRIDAMMRRCDGDNDGKISKEEAQCGGLSRYFDQLDRDKDGFIDRKDLEQAGMAGDEGDKAKGDKKPRDDKKEKEQ